MGPASVLPESECKGNTDFQIMQHLIKKNITQMPVHDFSKKVFLDYIAQSKVNHYLCALIFPTWAQISSVQMYLAQRSNL